MESTRELNAGLQGLYLSAINMQMNELMQTLTIFIPMTFIAGVYGMNFYPARGRNPNGRYQASTTPGSP